MAALSNTAVSGEANAILSPLGYEGGGRFTSIAFNPANPQVILIGSDVSGVFKSVDGGDSFSPKCEGLEEFAVADMDFFTEDSNHVVLLTDNGIYLSSDQGERWEKKSSAVRYNSRRLGDRLIVFHDGMLWVATDSAGVFRIRPTTGPWAPEEVSGLAGKQVSSLALHRGGLYAGTSQGVYKLHHGEWIPACDGLDPGAMRIENIICHTSGRIYLVERSMGVYAWNDAKKAWDHRGIGFIRQWTDRPQGFKAVAVHPSNPDILLLATYPETWPYMLYKSTDAGRSWTVREKFEMNLKASETFAKSLTDVEEIRFSPSEPSNVFITDWTNVWRSDNEGESWKQVYKGLQNTVVNDIVFHPLNESKLFLALSDNGLAASSDGGRTWKRRTVGLPDGDAVDVEISSTNPDKIYLLMRPWQGEDRLYIFRSDDGAKSWSDVSMPMPEEPLAREVLIDGRATNLLIDPASDEIIYVATNGYGIFRSDDGGRAWKAINKGLDAPYVKGPGALVADPSMPGTLYAATLKGGLFRTGDRGENWHSMIGAHLFAYSVALAPGNPTKIYVACADRKVIMSDDLGRTWRETTLPGGGSSGVAAYSLAVNPLDSQWILVGTMGFDFKASEGVFLSRDGGRTFFRCRSQMPAVGVTRVLFAPGAKGEQRFLIGLNGAGPYEGKIAEGSREAK